MPATREITYIKIKQLEDMIQEASAKGQDVSELQLQLEQIRKSFAMSGVALNENTSLLKG
jgi:hypothetical protein